MVVAPITSTGHFANPPHFQPLLAQGAPFSNPPPTHTHVLNQQVPHQHNFHANAAPSTIQALHVHVPQEGPFSHPQQPQQLTTSFLHHAFQSHHHHSHSHNQPQFQHHQQAHSHPHPYPHPHQLSHSHPHQHTHSHATLHQHMPHPTQHLQNQQNTGASHIAPIHIPPPTHSPVSTPPTFSPTHIHSSHALRNAATPPPPPPPPLTTLLPPHHQGNLHSHPPIQQNMLHNPLGVPPSHCNGSTTHQQPTSIPPPLHHSPQNPPPALPNSSTPPPPLHNAQYKTTHHHHHHHSLSHHHGKSHNAPTNGRVSFSRPVVKPPPLVLARQRLSSIELPDVLTPDPPQLAASRNNFIIHFK